jgi:hypothetical protein
MSVVAVIEQFAATRAQLDSACDLLVAPTPETLDRCSVLLESAGREMVECQSWISSAQGDPAALEAAWRVRRSYERAARLLKGAESFHANWMVIRGTLTGGYTNRGEPAPVRHAGRLCVEA